MDFQPREFAEDPEMHPAFQAMRVAAIGRPERRMGDAVIPAEPPRWSEVRLRAAELASGPAHLEVLATQVRAALALDGLTGLRRAFVDMADALETDWATMFPEPDEDDPDEPWYARSNLLTDLAADADFRDALARAPLASARGIGTFSARDLDIAAGIIDGSDEERARCQSDFIDGAFSEAPLEELGATAAALDGTLDAVRRIGATLERQIGAGASSAIGPVVGRLETLNGRFHERAAARLASMSETAAANDASGGTARKGALATLGGDTTVTSAAVDASSTAAPGATPALADHDAVRTAIDDIVRYYVRHEPGSPVAVLAARCRDLVGRGFFELVGTLCPETEYGGDLAARLAAPRRDPLATLLAEGFGNHLSGSESFDPAAYVDGASGVAEPVEIDDGGARPASNPVPATRADVLNTIDAVLAFYRAHEPSSPVPVVLGRVRTLVPLDFDGVLDTLRETLAAGASDA